MILKNLKLKAMNRKLKIENRKGHELHALLELPANQKPTKFAIFAHCFTCSSTLDAVKHISRALTNFGFGVVRFDFTGLGRSTGVFAESHFSGNVNDLLDVHRYIKENYIAPSLLIGHSLGGAASIVAASKSGLLSSTASICQWAWRRWCVRLSKAPAEPSSVMSEIEMELRRATSPMLANGSG